MKTSWKTTAAGIVTILLAGLSIGKAVLTGADPNWAVNLPVITAGIGALFARDHNVTSEQEGLKPDDAKDQSPKQ